MIAHSLLHQPIPEGLREEWSSHLAKPAVGSIDHLVALMVFRLGSEHYCLPASVIEEVASPGKICTLPHKRNSIVRGVTNVRGSIIVCIDLEKLLLSPPSRETLSKRLVIFHHQGWRVAAEVDAVAGMRQFDEDALKELPATHTGEIFSQGFFDENGTVVARLDEEKMFTAMRRQML